MDNVRTKMNSYFTQSYDKNGNAGQVTDIYLRKVLLEASVKLEKSKRPSGEYNTPWGLKIRYSAEKKSPELPTTYVFEYRVNTLVLQSWLKEHEYILDGPIRFTSKGIQFIYNSRSYMDYEEAAYMIDCPKNDNALGKQFLDLNNNTAVFAANRDAFNNNDWLIMRLK